MKTRYTLPERLRLVMTHLGMKPAEFARACGVQRQHVHQWLKGSKPSIESLRPLLERHGINPFWALYGEGDMITPLFKIPPQNRELYEFVASLSAEEASHYLAAMKLLRPAPAADAPDLASPA